MIQSLLTPTSFLTALNIVISRRQHSIVWTPFVHWNLITTFTLVKSFSSNLLAKWLSYRVSFWPLFLWIVSVESVLLVKEKNNGNYFYTKIKIFLLNLELNECRNFLPALQSIDYDSSGCTQSRSCLRSRGSIQLCIRCRTRFFNRLIY